MPTEIQTWVINLSESEDEVSACFRRAATRYFHLPVTAIESAEIIRGMDLDALIFTDIGMSGISIQPACLRLARKQFTAWGHPVTSGSPEIDYYISSALMEPENGQDHYSETLIRLPGSGLTYPRLQIEPSGKTHAELGVPEGGFLFFGQNPFKLIPEYDQIFLDIAQRSEKPLIFLDPLRVPENPLRKRLRHPNIVFLPFQKMADFLRLLQLAEVSLDSPGWNGGNTTIEALTLGTPVVSMPGRFMRGRHALAFLSQSGTESLIAHSPQQYVDLALDADRQRQAILSSTVDAIYEDVAPARALAELLLNL